MNRRFGLFVSVICLLALLTQSGCANVASSASQHTSRAKSAPLVVTQPTSQAIGSGQTATFSATASGTAPLSYQWGKNGAAISGATAASYTTPPETASAQFAVVVSNSVGSVTSNTATLTITTTPIAVTVNPGSLTLAVGGTQSFSGNVSGTSNGAITWTVSGSGCTGAACGTISASGLYVAPMIVPSPASVTVRATSAADPSKSASASVTIVTAVAVLLSLSPANASVVTAGTQPFNASVTGTSNTAVSWKVTGADCIGSACGSLSTSGLRAVYSAPPIAPSPAGVTVTAVSAADSTKSAAVNVTVVNVVAVMVSPSGLSIATGTTQQFNARVTGSSNIAVTWSVSGAGCSGVACGTINSGGLYTASAAIPSPATVAITATSSADPSKSGVAYLTIVAPGRTGPTLPTLPQATVDLTIPIQGSSPCPTLTTGSNCIRNVPAGDAVNFQKAISATTCGDTIVLAAGSTYSGNFTVPQTTCTNNSGWMIIKSSATASLPASNNRVGPSSVANMATISTPNSSGAISFQADANHWRLIGLEITTSFITTSAQTYALVGGGLDTNGAQLTSQALLPSFIIFDRDYLHGLSNTNVTKAFYMDAASFALVDSDCREIHFNGNDNQCLFATNGSGPYLIQNNYLEAAGENIMFGGADPVIANQIPSDITIVGNLFSKNLAWRGEAAPYNWVVKNLFEIKNAQRVLIDGNVFQNTWQAGQQEAMIIRSVNQRDGAGCLWCSALDVTVTNNLFQHNPEAIALSPTEAPSNVSVPTGRVLIQNNLMLDTSAVNWGGTGYVFAMTTASDLPQMHDIIIDHNTSFTDSVGPASPDFIRLDGNATVSLSNLQITNNLSDYGLDASPYGGIEGNGLASGSLVLSTYATGLIYNDMVFIDSSGSSSGYPTYPTGTFWSTQAGIGFTSVSGTSPNLTGNFQLTSGSAYHNAGTDGRDIGVWDWPLFNAKTAKAISGVYP